MSSDVELRGRSGRLVATNKLGATLEYDGARLRVQDVRVRDKKPIGWLDPIPVSAVFDVEWREPGTLWQGWLHFAYPNGKRHGGYMQRWSDGTCYFWPKEGDQYRAIRDAVIAVVRQSQELIASALEFTTSGSRVPLTGPNTPGMVGYRGLRVGEVSSHFDTTTTGTITGTIQHDLSGGFASAGIPVDFGLVDRFTRGALAITGSSTVEATTMARSRYDLMNEAFVAVFDLPDRHETIRLISPADRACRDFLRSRINEAAAHVDPEKLPSWKSARLADTIANLAMLETSMAVDRVNALSRLSGQPQPRVDIVGLPVAAGTLLGGALRVAGDSRWLQLFPFGLLNAIETNASAVSADENWMNDAADMPEGGLGADAPRTDARADASMKVCPQCAEEVRAAAKLCRYCRYEFPPRPPMPS